MIYLYNIYISMLGRSLLKFKQNKCKQHPDENYSLICLETDCEDRGIICAECQIIKHQDHLVKPLTLALKQISDDLQPMPHLLQTIAKIDLLYAKFYTLLGKLGRNMKTIEEELNRFFRNIHDRIRNYKAICSRILEEATLNEQFNLLIKKYKFYSREEGDRETTNFQSFIREILQYISERSEQFEDCIKKRAENRQILELLVPFESETKFNYSFSQQFKQANIQISPDGLTATQLNNYSTNFALVQPILEGKKALRTKRTIKFQINKLSSWLSLGVAYHSFASKANYYFNTGSVGHGGFLISYNGYSWHHTDSSLNSNCVTFNYAQGDIVSITINPSTKKLLFQKQNQSASFELPYEKINGQQLYFCVSLSSHQESVSIIK